MVFVLSRQPNGGEEIAFRSVGMTESKFYVALDQRDGAEQLRLARLGQGLRFGGQALGVRKILKECIVGGLRDLAAHGRFGVGKSGGRRSDKQIERFFEESAMQKDFAFEDSEAIRPVGIGGESMPKGTSNVVARCDKVATIELGASIGVRGRCLLIGISAAAREKKTKNDNSYGGNWVPLP
jgi:hypothetical protein